MKIAIIDNYDSFTYNLSHLVKALGAEVTVYRNDQFELPQLEAFSKIILSPGPGIPSEAGLLLDVIRTYAGKKPILGVCLGHQAIGEVFGGKLENLSDVGRMEGQNGGRRKAAKGYGQATERRERDRLWPYGTRR